MKYPIIVNNDTTDNDTQDEVDYELVGSVFNKHNDTINNNNNQSRKKKSNKIQCENAKSVESSINYSQD